MLLVLESESLATAGTRNTTGAPWISHDETFPVSSSGLGGGIPDSNHTVLFQYPPLPALLSLLAMQETAGQN